MRTTSTVGSDDRAVSDVVGYVLIFSLITISVGVITVGGFSTLEDRQDAERINNAERAFDVFAGNMEDVYRDGAPSRATEMRLSGGTLRYGEPINITIEDSNNRNITASPRPLIYRDTGTEIVYVAGAIIRSDDGNSVMLRDPPFRANTTVGSFPLIVTFRTTGSTTLSAEGTVQVTSEARRINTTTPAKFDDETESYTITIESPRSAAWEHYLESRPGFTGVTNSGGVVNANIKQNRIVAPRFPVRLRFSG